LGRQTLYVNDKAVAMGDMKSAQAGSSRCQATVSASGATAGRGQRGLQVAGDVQRRHDPLRRGVTVEEAQYAQLAGTRSGRFAVD
jgi:hypothetical protein